MGLFDFLKNKTKNANPAVSNKAESTDDYTLVHEMKLTDRDLMADEATVDRIVEKMVDEDPFKNFYSGKTKDDFTPLSQPAYKYETITTVNVDFITKGKGKIGVKVEDITLGFLPEDKAEIIQFYQEKYLLTAFVYVTGGTYMLFDPKSEEVIEDETPFGLDIYVQFT